MKVTLSLLLIIFTVVNIDCLRHFSTIQSFLLDTLIYRNAKFVTFFTCFNKYDTIQLRKTLNIHYISSNFVTLTYYVEGKNYEVFKRRTNSVFVLDVSCNNTKEVLLGSEEHNLYQLPYKWLIVDTKEKVVTNSSSIYSVLANVPLQMDSDVTVAVFYLENTTAVVYDVYKPSLGASKIMKITYMGLWAPNSAVYTIASKYAARRNMTGIFVRCGIVKTRTDNTPSIDAYYRQVTTHNYDTINKVSYALFTHIHEIHNFTFNLTIADRWFGNDDSRGGIDGGIAKLLYNNKIDFGVSSAILKSERIKMIEFIGPTFPWRTYFTFRNPGIFTKIQNEFLKPFASSLWFSILGYIILFCITLRLILFIQRFRDYEENSWISVWLLTCAVFCQQGAPFVPKPTSGRFTLLSLLLMSILLYNYYTSSIVSSLLSGLPPPFKTIEELSQSNLDVGMEDVVFVRTLFETTNDSSIKYFYNHKMLAHNKKPSYMKLEEGIARVKAGGFAYHTEPANAYPLIQSTFEPYQICDLSEINFFKPTLMYVTVQKGGPLNIMFTVSYLKMLESGIVARQKSIWFAQKPSCLANTHLVAVGIQPLLPAFLLLLFGAFMSMCLLIFEMFIQKNKKSHGGLV